MKIIRLLAVLALLVLFTYGCSNDTEVQYSKEEIKNAFQATDKARKNIGELEEIYVSFKKENPSATLKDLFEHRRSYVSSNVSETVELLHGANLKSLNFVYDGLGDSFQNNLLQAAIAQEKAHLSKNEDEAYRSNNLFNKHYDWIESNMLEIVEAVDKFKNTK